MNNFKSLLKELDKICNLPVTAKVLSRVNYRDHLESHHYYETTKTSKQDAVKDDDYFFSFMIRDRYCVIYQTMTMHIEQEWIEKEAKSTETAVRRAVKEFYKRYNK